MTDTDDDELWARRFHPSPQAPVRLVCFPHAGGAASYFHPLSAALAPDAEVLAIQYPGRQDRRRETCVDTIPELADRVFGALDGRVKPPFVFFGHSMGAVVAFEVALRFARAGGPAPSRLVVSGRRAPSSRQRRVDLGTDAAVVAELRRLGGTPEMFLRDPELLASIVQVTRVDYRALDDYAAPPDAVLDGVPVTALVGDSDPVTAVDDVPAWGRHTSGPFELHVFPGGHFFIESRKAEVTAILSKAVKALS
ncbi:alpha/beta fold hydrolase [Sphaerisporangium sp. TRM90804]|uniref:thioesterase II family protein n=1 Tax=Sphaerisporangium sp. TRM90804 TaxID=3031113 RepID=UPI00244858DC|nr:alpha/beta fold hydrolase [Sphaerisporangium sp. TRM90804]MDH2430752.1 alpha/beta fold hydrolase [Sphaerisporangium sp. TRM90804]